MEYDGEAQVATFIAGLLVGAVIGASASLLLAPQSGRRTRRKITRVASGVALDASDRWDTISDGVRERVDGAVTVAKKRIRA